MSNYNSDLPDYAAVVQTDTPRCGCGT